MTDFEDENDWYGEDTATFGDRLAGARDAAGLEQQALAEQLGVTVDSLDAWENDLREPRANRLQMLSGLLGVSLSWLLTGTGEGPDPTDPVQSAPLEINDILSEIRKLRAAMAQNADRLGHLEKKLRLAVRSAQ